MDKEPYLRFTPAEIDGFLTFILEGGADKRCSNVYRIIEQQRDDLQEALRMLTEAQQYVDPDSPAGSRIRRFVEATWPLPRP